MEPQPRCPCFSDSAELSPWAPDTRLSWEWKKPKERLNLCCLLTPASHARGLLSIGTASRNSLLSKQPSHRRTFLRNSAQRRSAMFDLLKLLSYLLERAGEKMSKWHPQDVSEHWEFVIRLWDRQILYPIDQEDTGYWGKNHVVLFSFPFTLTNYIPPCHTKFFWVLIFFGPGLTFEVTEKVQCEILKKKEGSGTMVPYGVCSLQSIHNPHEMTRQMDIKPFSFRVILLFASNVRLSSQRAQRKGQLPPRSCKRLVHQRWERIFPKKCSRSSLYWYFPAFQTPWIRSCSTPNCI